MRIELKSFQEDAARIMLGQIHRARRDAKDGFASAVVLSSPTGSGKTVILTQVLDAMTQLALVSPPEQSFHGLLVHLLNGGREQIATL